MKSQGSLQFSTLLVLILLYVAITPVFSSLDRMRIASIKNEHAVFLHDQSSESDRGITECLKIAKKDLYSWFKKCEAITKIKRKDKCYFKTEKLTQVWSRRCVTPIEIKNEKLVIKRTKHKGNSMVPNDNNNLNHVGYF